MTTAAASTTDTAPAAPPVTALAKPKRQQRNVLIKMGFETVQGFEAIQRLVSALAASSVVPQTFRGRPGTEGWSNCLVAVELATRLDLPPMMVMQNISVVDGKPGWLGKFFIALINKSGKFSALTWEKKGEPYQDEYGVRCVATRLSDRVVCQGTWITVKMAKGEGWWSKQGRSGGEYSKWQTMPDQMFVYRSASYWAQQFYPEGTLGLPSDDQLEDQRQEVEAPRLVAPPPPAAAPAPAAHQVVDAVHVEVAPHDRTLEPGFDPVAMDGEPAELVEIRTLLSAGQRAGARAAINRLPKDLQKAGADLYSASTR
jgi:hypothetical protein